MTPPHEKAKFRAGRWIRRIVLVLVLLYLLAAVLPFIFPPSSDTLPPDWQLSQSSDENVNMADLLETGEEAMAARLKLISQAKHSIRVASYIYATDGSGQAVASALLAAADRGVQVQLLVDGLVGAFNLGVYPITYALAAHPNIELRYYNPLDLLTPGGLNARFHEKYFIVDDCWLIMGGRNVSDEFLTPDDDPHYNYDLDVLLWKKDGAGYDAVAQVAGYFDRLWATCPSRFSTAPKHRDESIARTREELVQMSELLDANYGLSALDLFAGLVPVQKTVFMVNPTNPGVKQPVLWKQLCAMMGGAKERVWVLTPYMVMDGVMRDDLAALSWPGDSKILINSRNSGNNLIASADYLLQRGMVLNLGVPVYEFQGDSSMHTKSILIDRDLSIIGSFNFDMRSAYIDTEAMMAVYSPELNARLEAYMSPMYGDALQVLATGYATDTRVEPKEGSFWKTMGVYLLSPFALLFRFLL